jgi:hypothetical protein
MDCAVFLEFYMTRWLLACLAIFLCGCACAQEAMEVKVSSVTYLEADRAEVIPQGAKVMVVTEGLKSQQKYAAKVLVANQDNDYIEVFPEKNPFPPQVIEPFKPGEYLISGSKGERFNVSVRSKSGRPVWLVVVIGGGGNADEPLPPPSLTDYAELHKASLNEALKTRDPKTAKALASAWRSVATTKTVDLPLPQVIKAARQAREQVLLGRAGDINWNDYLTSVDGELESLKIEGTAEYLKVLTVLADSLDQAVVEFEKQNKVSAGR